MLEISFLEWFLWCIGWETRVSGSTERNNGEIQLPYGVSIARPHHAQQISLFPEVATEVWQRLAIDGVIIEEWRGKGWTRLSASASATFQGYDVMELQFLRDWQRDMPESASNLLELLPKPYRYDLSRLVFSTHGWLLLDTPEQMRWTVLDEVELWFPDLARRQPEFVNELLERIDHLL